MGEFDGARLSELLKTQIVSGVAPVRVAVMWGLSQSLDIQPGELQTLLPYACLLPSGEYDRSAFFCFYKIAAEHMEDSPDALGPALKQALQCERSYLGSNKEESIWDFDRQRMVALKRLLGAGRVDDFLDCIETVLDYRQRIFDFPAEDIRSFLQQIQSERAQKLAGDF
jgi:hypothetical protein